MNKLRRTEIQKVIDKLQDIDKDIAGVLMDEEEAKDGLPENLEGNERYEAMESAITALEESQTYVQETIEQLETAAE